VVVVAVIAAAAAATVVAAAADSVATDTPDSIDVAPGCTPAWSDASTGS